MDFGIFVEERRKGTSEADAFREARELAEAAEAWGLDGVWLGEIHFNPMRSVQSSPIALASFIAARTRRVRVGTAVQVLPLSNPLRIAEDIATVDHLSEGRFDFGVGRSGSPRAYNALGIPYAESQARFVESLEVIREAWKGQPFSFQGKFHRFENVVVSPRPYQTPHPPMRMAANSPDTFPLAGRLGLQLFVGVRDLDVAELRDHIAAYRKGWRDGGHAGDGDVCLRIPMYAAPTERAALEEPYENTMFFFRRQAEMARGGVVGGSVERRQSRVDKLAGLSYEEILTKRVAFGTASGLIERLGRLRDDLSLNGVIAELNPGGMLSMEQMLRTLRIVTHEVVPAFR
jgi:alkanesulfonate monooxygenase SsuD/methylene tetrahydromethanopterin reductase-like flavin-dependent oxidoreductase (luciferase family)